jgi:hypothetical protein
MDCSKIQLHFIFQFENPRIDRENVLLKRYNIYILEYCIKILSCYELS